MGYLPPRRTMEADAYRHPSIDRQCRMDDFVHHVLANGIEPLEGLEARMDELKWEILSEVQGRLEAEFVKSYLESQGIDVELFQESVGHHIYPVTVDGLGRVQIFVPKEQAKEAHRLYEEYVNAKD